MYVLFRECSFFSFEFDIVIFFFLAKFTYKSKAFFALEIEKRAIVVGNSILILYVFIILQA